MFVVLVLKISFIVCSISVCTAIVRGCLENRLYLQAKAGGQTAVENTDRKIVDFIRGSYSSNNPSFDPVVSEN